MQKYGTSLKSLKSLYNSMQVAIVMVYKLMQTILKLYFKPFNSSMFYSGLSSSMTAGISIAVAIPVTAAITAVLTTLLTFFCVHKKARNSTPHTNEAHIYENPIRVETTEIELEVNAAYSQVKYTSSQHR